MSENGGILYGTLSIPQTYHVNQEHDDKSLNFGALYIQTNPYRQFTSVYL